MSDTKKARPKTVAYRRLSVVVTLMTCCASVFAGEGGPWTRVPSSMRLGLPIPVSDTLQKITPSEHKVRERIINATNSPNVEPISLFIEKDHLLKLVNQVAKPGQGIATLKRFRQILADKAGVDYRIKPRDLKLLDPVGIARIFAAKHHSLMAKGAELQANPALVTAIGSEIGPLLTAEQRATLAAKIRDGAPIDVSTTLLPSFAAKMVGQFTVYQGPNCFHSSLAFQRAGIEKSPFYNLIREGGYHSAMINYDELWHALNGAFYEVDPSLNSLKYGDVLVFVDRPNENETYVDYRWIRHAATYLFGDYLFSKGSKSADSPYRIRTVQEEWREWNSRSTHLAIKVFRSRDESVTRRPPRKLEDWLF